MNDDSQKNVRYWISNISTAVLIFIATALYEGLFEARGAQLIIRRISDCFLIPGAIMGGIGSLCWIAARGNFDMLGYGAKLCITWILRPTAKKYETFYEYKVRQEEKNPGGVWPWRMFTVGLVCLALSIIFAVLFEVVV